jgi:type IV secretion system protein TrbF
MALPFVKDSVRASTTPEPVTPYQAAGQEWDGRIGSYRVMAKNWRIMALIGGATTFLAVAGLLVERARLIEVPFIVTVDERGVPLGVTKATDTYIPTDAQIAGTLARWIPWVRSISTDAVVVKKNWDDAYAFVADKAKVPLNEYAAKLNPIKMAQAGELSIIVEVTSVVRQAGDTFQVRWIEKSFKSGQPLPPAVWTGLFTVGIQQPRTHERLLINPLGLYITSYSWVQDSTR